MVNDEQISKEIRSIICEITELPDEKLKGHLKFVDDLGIESIMAVEILASLENKFNTPIPEERLMEIATLDQTVMLIKDLLSNQE
ncbi:acyl carrier protein [Candidatus Scalindua japonica]|uniref:Acyl carrier protein n=1 Tax=Candidatus Scalindua japonica TaxID=1284222 RepID=A0A286TTD1_9BACT|nr:acyl carrier protein [Candidatus Scalindua japonica]GAX59136.1 acyl carrier protein [Candidatus Scalindua japonica]